MHSSTLLDLACEWIAQAMREEVPHEPIRLSPRQGGPPHGLKYIVADADAGNVRQAGAA
jgi:hypothetical protein